MHTITVAHKTHTIHTQTILIDINMPRYLSVVLSFFLAVHGIHAAGSHGVSIRVHNNTPMLLRMWVPWADGTKSVDFSRLEYLEPGANIYVRGKDNGIRVSGDDLAIYVERSVYTGCIELLQM